MKKILCSIMVFALLCFSFSAYAAENSESSEAFSYVTDDANILTKQQEKVLEQKAKEVTEKYKCAVYIVTIYDYWDYDSDIVEAAIQIYREHELGYGSEKDGELLLLSMDNRKYALIAYGYGNTAFENKEWLEEKFLDDFKEDKWKDGLSDYIESSETMLKMAREGSPIPSSSLAMLFYDWGIRTADPLRPVAKVCSVIVAIILAGLAMYFLKKTMKNVRTQDEAKEYVINGKSTITKREAHFVEHTVSSVIISKGSDSSSGSSGGFSSSSGSF